MQHFEEKRLLAVEMAIEDRLGDAGGQGDFLGRGLLIAERDEELLGMVHQLPLAVRGSSDHLLIMGAEITRRLTSLISTTEDYQ